MLVSCLCPTYNRAPDYLHLLGEAVESFVRQCLPVNVRAELVILNDTPGQELTCEAAAVRVINVPGRYRSLGEKFNTLVHVSMGDVLMPWEDDDISLSGRIAQTVEFMRRGYEYFNPQCSWYLDRAGLHSDHSHGVCHNASAFSRDAWRKAGGYPEISGNQDGLMDRRLKQVVFGTPAPIRDKTNWQYIYRWGVSPYHLSGVADGPAQDPHGPHYRRVGEAKIVPGTFRIEPAWRADYQRLCREALS